MYAHRYTQTTCPNCGADLTRPAAVHVVLGDGEHEPDGQMNTQLDADGVLMDPSGDIAEGRHCGSICNHCHKPIEDVEDLGYKPPQRKPVKPRKPRTKIPRVLIVVEGGLVSSVIADAPIKVLVKDFDCIKDDADYEFDPDGFDAPDQIITDPRKFEAEVLADIPEKSQWYLVDHTGKRLDDDSYDNFNEAHEAAEKLGCYVRSDGCEHPVHDDHMICTECGRCRESLDSDDVCSECGGKDENADNNGMPSDNGDYLIDKGDGTDPIRVTYKNGWFIKPFGDHDLPWHCVLERYPRARWSVLDIEPTELVHLLAAGLEKLADLRIKTATAESDHASGELILVTRAGTQLTIRANQVAVEDAVEDYPMPQITQELKRGIMKPRQCEHGEFTGTRCRKRARFVIGYKVLFAHRICACGEEPVYMEKVTYRCAEHDKVENETQRAPITAAVPATAGQT